MMIVNLLNINSIQQSLILSGSTFARHSDVSSRRQASPPEFSRVRQKAWHWRASADAVHDHNKNRRTRLQIVIPFSPSNFFLRLTKLERHSAASARRRLRFQKNLRASESAHGRA